MSRYGSFAVDTADEEQKLFDRRLAARILTFTAGMRGWVVLALVSAPLLSAIQLARPYIMKLAVDEAILPGDSGLLIRYAALFLAVLVGELGGMFGQLMLLTWIGQRVLVRLREALYRRCCGSITTTSTTTRRARR